MIAVSRRFHWPNPPPTAHALYSFEEQSEDLNRRRCGTAYGLHYPALVRSLTLIELPFGSLVPPSASGFAAELASRDSMIATLRVHVGAGSVEHAPKG